MSRRAINAVRKTLGALAFGIFLTGVAGAGVVIAPSGTSTPNRAAGVASSVALASASSLAGTEDGSLNPPDLSNLARLPAGEFLVGASTTSLAPDPEKWQTEGCSEYLSNFPAEATHLAGYVGNGQLPGWPRSPDCIYLGGYGIGPARAATGVDPHAGVNVRSIAVSNGSDTVVWQMIDMVGYFAQYREELCDSCGILDIRRRIARETGIPHTAVAIGSTHTHGGADGYGAWGGMPTWYREQVRDQVIVSAYDAIRAMKPAALAVGSVDARPFNNERRNTYYSTPDYGAVWLQATALASDATTALETNVIATLVNFGAHPTVLGDQPLMHGDWPAAMAKQMGGSFGGTGLVFEGGLGNVSPGRPKGATVDLTGDGKVDDYDQPVQMAADFTDFIGRDIARGGHRLADNTIISAEATVEHPVTNVAEAGLGYAGLLDRAFTPGDAAGLASVYTWSKQSDQGLGHTRNCTAAAPVSVKTQVSGYRIGELTVLTGPGELFSNATEVVKSRFRRSALEGGQTMVFGQTQDSLGYIIQSFEVDPVGGALTNVDVEGSPAEYEETFMLDKCFGDHVVQSQLDLAGQLNR